MEQKRFNTLAKAGKTALYWLLGMALAAAAQPLIIIGSKDTGEDVSSFIFSSKVYAVNPFFAMLGMLLGIGGFAWILWKLLLPGFRNAKGAAPLMIIWITQALLGLIGMLASGFLMALFLENRTGAVFRPEWIGLFALWFPCLAAVMTVAGCIIAYRKSEE